MAACETKAALSRRRAVHRRRRAAAPDNPASLTISSHFLPSTFDGKKWTLLCSSTNLVHIGVRGRKLETSVTAPPKVLPHGHFRLTAASVTIAHGTAANGFAVLAGGAAAPLSRAADGDVTAAIPLRPLGLLLSQASSLGTSPQAPAFARNPVAATAGAIVFAATSAIPAAVAASEFACGFGDVGAQFSSLRPQMGQPGAFHEIGI